MTSAGICGFGLAGMSCGIDGNLMAASAVTSSVFNQELFNSALYCGIMAVVCWQRVVMAKSWMWKHEWLMWVLISIADVIVCIKHTIEAMYLDHDRVSAIMFAATAGLCAYTAWVCWRDRPRKKGSKEKSKHVVKWLNGRLRLVPVIPAGAS